MSGRSHGHVAEEGRAEQEVVAKQLEVRGQSHDLDQSAASSEVISVFSDVESEMEDGGEGGRGGNCSCMGNPEQFFSRFGAIVALLGTCMTSVTNLLASVGGGDWTALIVNVVVLGAIQGPTTCALLYFFFKEPVKALLRLRARCVAIPVERKRRQAQRLLSHVEGMINTGFDISDVGKLSKQNDLLHERLSPDILMQHGIPNAFDKSTEKYENSIYISGEGIPNGLNYACMEAGLTSNTLQSSALDASVPNTTSPRVNFAPNSLEGNHKSEYGNRVSEVILAPSSYIESKADNNIGYMDRNQDSKFRTGDSLDDPNRIEFLSPMNSKAMNGKKEGRVPTEKREKDHYTTKQPSASDLINSTIDNHNISNKHLQQSNKKLRSLNSTVEMTEPSNTISSKTKTKIEQTRTDKLHTKTTVGMFNPPTRDTRMKSRSKDLADISIRQKARSAKETISPNYADANSQVSKESYGSETCKDINGSSTDPTTSEKTNEITPDSRNTTLFPDSDFKVANGRLPKLTFPAKVYYVIRSVIWQ